MMQLHNYIVAYVTQAYMYIYKVNPWKSNHRDGPIGYKIYNIYNYEDDLYNLSHRTSCIQRCPQNAPVDDLGDTMKR